MSRPILYLSGPYSATPDRTVAENIEEARQFALLAWRAGWAAFCPHLNTAHFETCCDLTHADWMDGDLTFIERMDPERDAMMMLPGWTKSKGALLEHETACSRRIHVYYSLPPPPLEHLYSECKFYREGHLDTCRGDEIFDLCANSGRRCPPGVSCPIRRRAA